MLDLCGETQPRQPPGALGPATSYNLVARVGDGERVLEIGDASNLPR